MTDSLHVLMPDAARGARTISRCHDRLAARRRRLVARRRVPNSQVGADRLLVAGLCVAYLIPMVGNLLGIAGP